MKPFRPIKNLQQASFTLFETIVALGIMATMVVELAALQGNTIYFSEFSQNSTQAIWLAKRVMSQVEYNWVHRDFKDIKEVENVRDVPFEDAPEFKYTLLIKTWKLPILEMLTGSEASNQKGEDSSGEAETGAGAGEDALVEQGLKQVLGDDILKVANVKVSWAEGASSSDVSLTYLLTSQRKIDEAIETLKPSTGGKGSGGGKGNNSDNPPVAPGENDDDEEE